MLNKDLSEPLLFDHKMSVNVSYGNYYQSFPTHWHNFMELMVPLGDDYQITVGSNEYHLNKNQFAIIPPRTLHSVVRAKNCPTLIIQFSNQLLPQLHDFILNRQLFCGQTILDSSEFTFYDEKPLEILLKIKDSFYGEGLFRELSMYESLLHFFILVGNYNNRIRNELTASRTPQQRAYDQKFDSIALYLREHYTSSLSLEEVASFAGFSKYHFSRIFRDHFQMNFPEYITSLRISKSMELLEDPDLSVMDVASLSGFSSLVSFNRAFKLLNQCTPSQFRKMIDHSNIS